MRPRPQTRHPGCRVSDLRLLTRRGDTPSPSKSLTRQAIPRPRVTTLRGGRRVVRGVTAPTPRTLRRGPAGSFQVQAARAAIDDGCEINTTTPGRKN